MIRAIYNLTSKVLIVTGNEIKTFIETIDEMGEWRTLYDLDGNPLYDVQLDFDDSIDKTSVVTELNPKNYNVQYVNLIKLGKDNYEMGHNWKNAELTIIRNNPSLEVIGVTNEFVFAKEKVRHDKALQKKMETHICYGIPNGDSFSLIGFNGSPKLKDLLSTDKGRTAVIKLFDKVRNALKNGEEILNTNLKEIGVQ